MRAMILCSTAVIGLSTLTGCVFPTVAKQWNSRVDQDGEPVYYVSASKVGVNLLVVIPFMGDLSIDGLVDDLTGYVAEKEGDAVRIVQANSENYWYGYSPFTWIVSPVVATVAAEYRPSEKEQAEQLVLEKDGGTEARWYKPWSW